ncbi:hypothetical protein B0A48_16037 [Cryoendolithus antarcticus]|uniref:Lipocalin-like domain-containing protein n=1 Tax=Cryoendolithus antarcticus TaxID=1507870 RepID=A0A1V8SFC3_9PEZI|nr:hypothetical protein B0A48_16037 [Cryoendolithus antarcticus]
MADLWKTHGPSIVGLWKCISFEILDVNDNNQILGYPMGSDPLARVQVSPSGYLSAHLATPKTASASKDADTVPVAETVLTGYCGYLTMFKDAEGLGWKTKVDIGSDRHPVGGFEERRLRYWEEGGKDFMELSPAREFPLPDGKMGKGVLIWEKIE